MRVTSFRLLGSGTASSNGVDQGKANKRTRAAELLALGGPSAISALQAFKHMNHNSAFRFHDRPDESELSSAETAVMV